MTTDQQPLAPANTDPPELVEAVAAAINPPAFAVPDRVDDATRLLRASERVIARGAALRAIDAVRAYDAEQAATRSTRALVMDLCRALGHDPARVSGIVADVESIEVTEHPTLSGTGPRTVRTEYLLTDRPRTPGGGQ